jgi:dephospho-CoA kinase
MSGASKQGNHRARYFGLTGGIASGKTTVAQMFESLGARVIDADHIGHELIRPSAPAYTEIIQAFSREILSASEEIDRRRLGALVFADPKKLRRLNAILHPRIIERTEELAARYWAEDPLRPILVDAALLFEAGIGAQFLKVIVTSCMPEQQVDRLIAKTGLPRDQAEKRIAVQMPMEEKRRRADFVIDTSGALEATRKLVEALYPQLRALLMQV